MVYFQLLLDLALWLWVANQTGNCWIVWFTDFSKNIWWESTQSEIWDSVLTPSNIIRLVIFCLLWSVFFKCLQSVSRIFLLMKLDDYFWVNFEHLWIKPRFWSSCNNSENWLEPAISQTTMNKFTLSKSVTRFVVFYINLPKKCSVVI